MGQLVRLKTGRQSGAGRHGATRDDERRVRNPQTSNLHHVGDAVAEMRALIASLPSP